jgi:hypothetical protein
MACPRPFWLAQCQVAASSCPNLIVYSISSRLRLQKMLKCYDAQSFRSLRSASLCRSISRYSKRSGAGRKCLSASPRNGCRGINGLCRGRFGRECCVLCFVFFRLLLVARSRGSWIYSCRLARSLLVPALPCTYCDSLAFLTPTIPNTSRITHLQTDDAQTPSDHPAPRPPSAAPRD